MTRAELPATIAKLIDRFRSNKADYLSAAYNEEQTRADFLAPLFEALGWDVSNTSGVPHKYRDVLHEAAIRIAAGRHKSPDYSFRIEGQRRFFVEAKKPSVDVKKDAAAAFQLRHYGWSAGLPVSVLSNFRTTCLYDCRYEPKVTDKADVALLLSFDHEELSARWAELEALLSRDAVAKGALDRYADKAKAARGRKPVDEAFLAEIELWRNLLAEHVQNKNPSITVADLNFAVQATIDRIIFLRMCEDRGIEPYGQLQQLAAQAGVYQHLVRLYLRADDRYNSGLFHFKEETGRAEPHDPVTPLLVVEDEVLREIVGRIYFPQSPYAFRYLDPFILGQVYEQFLGKVIVVSGGRAEVQEKPEVKKAGGVYYTPNRIVSYIVERTIGASLEGKRPSDVHKFRIVDAACGSGSFLLGAYRYLLDWYRDKYVADLPAKKSRNLFRDGAGEWRLTLDERKRILLRHIFGTDIDLQAVEVTKLSLLLTVLEGENAQTIAQQLEMFRQRALPDLGSNIRCGNSIIANDYYDDEQLVLFPTKRDVNTFEWEQAFSAIFDDGGFDVAIGNPPYIDSELMTTYLGNWRAYCTKKYRSASGNWDIFCVFVEKTMQLLKPGGLCSLIVPNKLGSADYAAGAREALTTDARLVSVRDYSAVKVFPVSVYPIVYVAARKSAPKDATVRYERMVPGRDGETVGDERDLDHAACFSDPTRPWRMYSEAGSANPVERIRKAHRPLGEVATVLGAATVAEAYETKKLIAEANGSKDGLKFVNSGTIDRYAALWGVRPCRYIKNAYDKPVIPARVLGKLAIKRHEQATTPKVIIAGMTKVIECFADERGEWLAGKSTTIVLGTSIDLRYITAILNSKFATYYFLMEYGGNRLQGGYLRIGPPQVKTIPIREPDLSNRSDKALHDKLLVHVTTLTTAYAELSRPGSPHARHTAEKQVDALERQIDDVVYQLYGLSAAEIAAVESTYAEASGGSTTPAVDDEG